MKNKNIWKRFSIWEWFAMIAIAILVVATVCTAIVIANKKHELDELNKKNDEITEEDKINNFESEIYNFYLNKIENNQL